MRIISIACMILVWASSSFGASTNSLCEMEIRLVDGSSIMGTVDTSHLPFHNAFAKFDIDLHRIETIDFSGESEEIRVILLNGDLLTVIPDFAQIKLNTLFGPTGIALRHITTIAVSSTGAPRRGLIAEYLFSGNARDSSGNKGHGTVHGPKPTKDRFGTLSKAYAFNGDSQWIDVAESKLIDRLDAITVSLWVMPRDLGAADKALVTKQPSGECSTHPSPTTSNHGGLFDIEISESSLYFCSQIGPGMSSEGTKGECPNLSDGKWHHIAITADNSSRTLTFYLDGNKLSSHPIKAPLLQQATNEPLRIGARKDSDGQQSYYIGSMDELRIYNRSLSGREVRKLFNALPDTDQDEEAKEEDPASD